MNKKYIIFIVVMAIAFCIGLGIFMYPFVATIITDQIVLNVSYDVEDAMLQMDYDTLVEYREAAQAYNDSLTGLGAIVASEEAVYTSSEDNYNNLLNFSNGVMGYVSIPSIDVKLPIYHGTTDEVLAKGAGHLYGTSLPIGGSGCHAVLVSHSGLSNATLFTHLPEVKEGDLFYISILGDQLAYRVDQISIVEPNEVDNLVPIEGEDHVTLVTCYPVTVNTHRLLVRGTRDPSEDILTTYVTQVEYDGKVTKNVSEDVISTEERDYEHEREVNRYMVTLIICFVVFFIVAVGSTVIRSVYSYKKKKKKAESLPSGSESNTDIWESDFDFDFDFKESEISDNEKNH